MPLPPLYLKKGEERRIRAGHVWVYSNEIDTKKSPLKNFTAGAEVLIVGHDGSPLGVGYVNPHSLITARLLSRNTKEALDTAFFIRRIQQALTLRQRLFATPFYRLIFGEGDQLPGLVVDRFADTLVVQLNTAGMELRKANIVTALTTVLPTTTAILLRNDSPIREHEGLPLYTEAALGTPPETLELIENGAKFHAPLWQGQKTGWFYDHRFNRARLKDYVQGRDVLDVFSYLGAWGIQAGVFGAKSVTMIESSKTAAQFIQQNTLHNQLSAVTILQEDAFAALKALAHANQQFDVIVLDPPAFIKKQKDKAAGFIAYQRLFELALKLLKAEGILFACSCSMHLGYADLIHLLQRASTKTNRPLQILEQGHQSVDHPIHAAIPETDYLKLVVVRVLGTGRSEDGKENGEDV